MKLTLKEAQARMYKNGGSLYLSGTQITNKHNYKVLKDGDCVSNRYIYADGILTHISSAKKRMDIRFTLGK